MAFYADTFVFDGINCSAYDLILFDVRQGQSDTSQFASGPTISEDFVNRRWRPNFYGVTRPDKLTFQMSVGLNACRMQAGTWLTRAEIANIMKWLTGHDTYKFMWINQDDMQRTHGSSTSFLYRYLCMITNVELQFIDDKPWGFTFTVTCDSPYAYKSINVHEINMTANGSTNYTITSDSCMEQLYLPVFKVTYTGVTPGTLTIHNTTTSQTLSLTDIPSDVTEIVIDCERGIIKSTPQRNLYAGFNFVFIGLARGTNSLTFSNTGTEGTGGGAHKVSVDVTSMYPIDIGA